MSKIYIAHKLNPRTHQITIEEILTGLTKDFHYNAYDGSAVRVVETDTSNLIYNGEVRVELVGIHDTIKGFMARYSTLYDCADKGEMEKHYSEFRIPKHSGGFRKITAPDEELKNCFKDMKQVVESIMHGYTYHTSAFAYVRKRCCIDAVKRHQMNGSRWILKMDFHDFFGSVNQEFLKKQLLKVYPWGALPHIRSDWGDDMWRFFSLCFLNDALPQGTPMSPLLTNIIMMPYDYKFFNGLRNGNINGKEIHFDGKCENHKLVYTRYCDDVHISCRVGFDWKTVQDEYINLLKADGAPLSLSVKKTHYGSTSGRNWMLGVMLNKDNQITVGYQKKKRARAAIYNFISDQQSGVEWSVDDVQHLQGVIAYYKSIEGEYFENLIDTYNKKFNVNFDELIKTALTGGAR